jgi:predicted ATPase
LLYAERPGLVCRLFLAWRQWLLGYPDRALAMIDAAVALGNGLSHAPSLAYALNFAAVLRYWRREFEAARRQAEAALAVAREHSIAQWLAFGTMGRGAALAHLGQHEEAMAELHAGFAAWHRTGARLCDSMWLGFTAEAHAAAGQFDAAFAALDRAAERATANAESFYRAELHRLRGAFHLQMGESAKAEHWLNEAIRLARGQVASSFELRASTSLARQWRDQDKRAEARELLAPIYSWFTEGFDTPDLREAKALLDALR